MKWLVLESLMWPGAFRLHSEPKWDGMMPRERQLWKVIKVCVDRDEANSVIDEVKAKAGRGASPR